MPRRRRRRKNSFLKRMIIRVLMLALLFFGTYAYYTNLMLSPVDETDTTQIAFEIRAGESLDEIGQNLRSQNIIKSSSVFKSHLKRKKLDTKVKAGNFILRRDMYASEIAEVLISNKTTESALTIQEGLTIKQIDEKLSEQGLIEPGELQNFEVLSLIPEEGSPLSVELHMALMDNNYNLEGFLFPDTYFINPQRFHLDTFVERLMLTMDERITSDMRSAYKADNRSLHEILTMASIIEREVQSAKDMALVSGILWKRYDSGWTLGADATIVYITDNADITLEDLNMDSSYNTRKYLGLPPTPIASPGAQSIEAAIYPKNSNYWFYLTTLDTGEVIYAQSNEEHNSNKNIHLR